MKDPQRKIGAKIGIFYLAFLIIWIGLRFLVQDSVWWVALLNTYPFLITLPALVLSVLLLWRGSTWIGAGLMIGVVFIFILNFGALFWPNQPLKVANGRSFTVMTYNIKFNNGDDEAMLAAIHSADADIVGLQEVTLNHTSLLETELGALYPYRVFAQPEFNTDVAILSKYPVEELATFVLQPRRMSMHAILDVEGDPLHLFVVHLTPTQLGDLDGQSLNLRVRERFSIRLAEVTGLILELNKIEAPAIILCDCNFVESSQAYRNLSAHVKDVHREIGWGFGKSNFLLDLPFPLQRVDYVWYSEGVQPTAVGFSDRGRSDHKPILATFEFTE